MTIKERVQNLRKLMKEKGIDAYIIPSADAHQSEYVAEHFKCRQWISGFTGSAGTVVVTLDEAGLWTDGRYFIQAEKQLRGSEIKLFKMGEPGVPTYMEFIKNSLHDGNTVGFDGRLFSHAAYLKMNKLFSRKGIKINTDYDLVDKLWVDRPSIPKGKVFIHDLKFAGKSRTEKLEEIRKEMKDKGADVYLLTQLDDIAWLYNLRGSDVPINPVFYSYTVIFEDAAHLFIDEAKLTDSVKDELKHDGITLHDYEDVGKFLKDLKKEKVVLLDGDKTSEWLYKSMPTGIEIIDEPNISTMIKAVRNEIEIKNYRNCQVRDGVAMVKFLYWLKKNVGKEKITEIDAEDKLEEYRRQGENFLELSFDTICAYMDHAAMMHYKAQRETQYEIKDSGFLLVDSGAHYLDGTTDITRTFVLGKISDEMRRDFTLVLKANIALSSVKFLYGATGSNLDVLARKPIWEYGLDYKCGTGHGVGYCLNVHELPQRFSPVPNFIRLEKGMIITNEPGIYLEGKYGIRTENDMLTVEDEKTEFGQFMRFEPITYCPIDLDGIDTNMLTQEEKCWLNSYHKKVYELLSPSLNTDEKEFLRKETREI